ncbi:MAG: hypothetical protein LUQ31_07270 [Methanoregula sp.]|nr:hypothetical protein [Methanoregula sp.]
MAGGDDALLSAITGAAGDGTVLIDRSRMVPGVTAYAVRSFDSDALQFSIPVLVTRPLVSEIPLDPRGAAGAVALLIERIKQKAAGEPALGPLAGKDTRFPGHYAAALEPYTLVRSPDALASDLWHADTRNFADAEGIHLVLCGAVPYPAPGPAGDLHMLTDTTSALLDAVKKIVIAQPARVLETAWISALDQQLLRDRLPALGLVSFVGDGAKPARSCTQYRCFFRTAGPKTGVNIPFSCPQELDPVEIELPASNRIVTGLGIKQREVFAVAGSNAQGKTTFLEGIIAGMDDHATGDGRESIVTVQGVRSAEAMNCELAGADISMFFSALPPGIDGTVKSAYGMGSGSMTMARQVQQAIRQRAPLLIIDEDRAAPNLLVRSCLQRDEITPLAEILSYRRDLMGGTTLLFAACAMDALIAEADRIMVLDRCVAFGIEREEFRRRVADMMREVAGGLEKDKPENQSRLSP